MSTATVNDIAPFNPLCETYLNNPWAEFKRMRESCRAYRHENTIMPVVSFFHDADLRAMRANWQTWSSSRGEASNKLGLGAAAVMIGQDPPEHTFFRSKVAPHFMPGKVGALQPKIDESVAKFLDRWIDNGEVEYHEQVSAALATSIIGTICGIQEEDWPLIRQATIDSSRDYGKGPLFSEPQPEIEARLQKVAMTLGPFIVEHIKTLRKAKTPSILTQIADEVDNEMAVIGLCSLIIGAGNDTSSNLMTNGLWELIQKPEQMQWLRENPDKIDQAVEEMVRCRGSLRRSERCAAKDLEFDGVEINKGDIIMLWNASGSRDPEVVPDRPDEFDITRKPSRHMGFGAGIHMCIGNVLARLETRTLLRELLKRSSTIEEVGDDAYQSWGNGVLDAVKSYRLKISS